MGKDDDWGKLFFLVAGLWLFKEIMSKKNVNYYRCWNCNRLIPPNTNPCPFCRANIDWGGMNESV